MQCSTPTMATTTTTTKTFNYPVGIQKAEGEYIEVDLGQDSLLTVMMDNNCYLYFFLRQTTVKGSTKKSSVISASYPTVKSFPTCYSSVKWEYFGNADSLVVCNNYKAATVKVNISKGVSSLYVQSVENSTLAVLKEKQQLLQSSIALKNENVKSAFGEIYSNTDVTDFTIKCKDGTSVEVHGAVLSTFWPFFKGLMSNECIEKTERTLRLDFSSDWVKLMVAHIYKQPLKLSFDEATGMVLLSNMYLLPELGDIAEEQIRTLVNEKTLLEDLLIGWDRSREASHEELKQLFAKRIAKKDPMRQTDLFKGWEEVKLLELYFDTSKVV